MRSLDEILAAAGLKCEVDWQKKSAWEMQSRWRKAFLPEWSEWTGGYALEWNALPRASSRVLTGAAAVAALADYEDREASAVVCERLGRPPVLRLRLSPGLGRQLLQGWHHDAYIVDCDFEWCAVLTHEALGPYFVVAASP